MRTCCTLPLPCHLVSFRSAFLTTQFTFFSSPLQNVLRNATQHRAFLEWWSWSKQSQTLAGGSCGYPSAPDFRPCHLRLKNKLSFAAEQIASCTHTRACGTHTSYFAAISELAASLCTSHRKSRGSSWHLGAVKASVWSCLSVCVTGGRASWLASALIFCSVMDFTCR